MRRGCRGRGCRKKRVSASQRTTRTCLARVREGGVVEGWCRQGIKEGVARVSTGDIELVLSQTGVGRGREEGVARSGCRQGKGKGSVSRDQKRVL